MYSVTVGVTSRGEMKGSGKGEGRGTRQNIGGGGRRLLSSRAAAEAE